MWQPNVALLLLARAPASQGTCTWYLANMGPPLRQAFSLPLLQMCKQDNCRKTDISMLCRLGQHCWGI